jgi:hypothetical protein
MKVLTYIRNLLLAVTVILAIWIAIPPRMFIDPQVVAIENYGVTVYESFPLYSVLPTIRFKRIESIHSIPTESGGISIFCTRQKDVISYLRSPEEFNRWNIEAWAKSCMEGDYIWRGVWIPYLFGLIPLRPILQEYILFQSRAPSHPPL